MEKKASELIFISQILRDGSGTIPVDKEYIEAMEANEYMKGEKFKVTILSVSYKTYIASGFNSFVVKLRNLTTETEAKG